MNDTELLQGFTEQGSESAFRALVERHLPLVMGTARRITDDSSLAEEVAQTVFILLAHKARTLGSRTILAGWLYRTTCFVAARARRAEQRRRRREQEAAAMQTQTDSDPLWQQIRPRLDDALGRLDDGDRNALVLRFFEERSLREVGTATGTTEEAAKKRVHRALEKLRRLLGRRGMEINAGALAAGLTQEGAQAAVAAGLVSTISTTALAPAAAGSSALVAEALNAWRWAKIKAALGLGMGAVAVALLIPMALPFARQSRATTVSATVALAPAAPALAEPTTASVDNPLAGTGPASIEVGGQTITMHPLQITVLDAASGSPIAGANVRHDLMVSLANLSTPLPPVKTDSNGIVTLQVPDPIPQRDARMAQFNVQVNANGYASRTIGWLCTTGDVLSMVSNQYTVRLEPGTTLSGTVVDENGHPLPGVQVGALGNGYRGYSQSMDQSGKVTSPPEKRVEDYPKFFVSIEKPGPDSVFTDRVGRFQFIHFPSDLRSLVIELLGDDGVRRKFRTPEGRKLTADALPEVSLQDLRQGTARLVLLRGITIDGVVVDASNNPVMDATVTENRFQWGLYRPFSRTNTDYAGRFWLPNIAPREIVLAASAEGFASVLTTVVVQPAMASVRIQLPPEQPLHGRVVNEAGEPVADAAVKTGDVTAWGLDWSGKTDADGRFSWLGAPLSEMAVWIMAGERGSRMLRFSASKEEHLITLRTSTSNAVRVTGKVTDALTGAPVEHFRVGIAQNTSGGVLDPPRRTMDGWHGVLDVQAFRTDIPIGHKLAWGLRIEAEGYDPTCTRLYDFFEGDQQLEFALQPGGTVEGVVQSPEGGLAADAQLAFVANHDPVLTSQAGQLSNRYRTGNSDAEGRFKFAKPVEPQALVVFHDSGWAVVPLAKAAGSLPVRLLPWGRIEGTVVNGQTPVASEPVGLQKLVWSWSDALAPLYSTVTDDTGHFAFEKVPAGEFQISLAARAWQRRGEVVKALETAVRIAAGETQTVKLWTSGQSVLARLHGPPSIARPAWTNASAVLRRDVIVPPEPAQSDYVSDTSLRAARDRYAHDPAVLAAVREARSYVGSVASDGLVTFANIPPGRYALEVQLFTERNERRPSGGVEENSVAARVRAAVSVPATTNTSEDTSVPIGDFTLEPL